MAALAALTLARDDFAVCASDLKMIASTDERLYALNATTVALLQKVNVWERLEATPMNRIELTDSPLEAAVRPVEMTFQGQPLAQMVTHSALLNTCVSACEAQGLIHACRHPSLTVVAEGAGSLTRQHAGIVWHSHDYNQTALVATLGFTKPHNNTAIQHFTPEGTLALLPGSENTMSLVWAMPTVKAEERLRDAQTLNLLQERIGYGLGTVFLKTPFQAWPLKAGYAETLHASRMVLIGDAAHAVHPLAGQGFNLGVQDLLALRLILGEAARLGLDLGSRAVGERYTRMRLAKVRGTVEALTGLNALFRGQPLPITLAHTLGLRLLERLPRVKSTLMDLAGT
jgi:2-octaprenyl-6-methoxyphenol hydroxylase